MTCPVCQRCPFAKGVCEDRVNRGRRFFLVGALALPVALKIERVAPIVTPAVLSYFQPVSYAFQPVDIATGACRWDWRYVATSARILRNSTSDTDTRLTLPLTSFTPHTG